MSIRTTIPCILAAIWWALIAGSAQATTRNIAPLAQARASSEQDGAHAAHCINDGIIGVMGKGSWASDSKMMFWGEIDYPWIELEWEQEVCIDRVVIYDRPEAASTCSGGELVFDNGQKLYVRNIPSDGTAREVRFPARHTRRLRFNVTDGNHSHIGLSEIEVFEAPQAATAYIHMADPYIETTRGRYFYFVTGSTPFGMISAAPLTRNKNQGGGGYNYNDTEVLGFPQIHGWMLSGLDLMPTTGDINPTLGEEGVEISLQPCQRDSTARIPQDVPAPLRPVGGTDVYRPHQSVPYHHHTGCTGTCPAQPGRIHRHNHHGKRPCTADGGQPHRGLF